MVAYNCIRHFTAYKGFHNKCCFCCAQKTQIDYRNTLNTADNIASKAIAEDLEYGTDLSLIAEDTPLSQLQQDNNSLDTDLVLDGIEVLESPINNSTDMTLVSDSAPLYASPAYAGNFMEQSANTLIETTARLTDAIAKFLACANTNHNNDTKPCGLLHFKEWWELTGVNICVNGEQISGIPISVTEDSMRVIDNNYSYFIPLEKVDYIRTNDGLLTDFKSPNSQPV